MSNHEKLHEQHKKEAQKGRWLRSRDVQKMLGIGSSTLQSLRISGALPAYKLSGMWFYKEHEVINALEKGKFKKEVKNDRL